MTAKISILAAVGSNKRNKCNADRRSGPTSRKAKRAQRRTGDNASERVQSRRRETGVDREATESASRERLNPGLGILSDGQAGGHGCVLAGGFLSVSHWGFQLQRELLHVRS